MSQYSLDFKRSVKSGQGKQKKWSPWFGKYRKPQILTGGALFDFMTQFTRQNRNDRKFANHIKFNFSRSSSLSFSRSCSSSQSSFRSTSSSGYSSRFSCRYYSSNLGPRATSVGLLSGNPIPRKNSDPGVKKSLGYPGDFFIPVIGIFFVEWDIPTKANSL